MKFGGDVLNVSLSFAHNLNWMLHHLEFGILKLISLKIFNEELKVDELEQYDRRQNLIFEGVPQFQNENVTEIILSLASKLNVNLTANDISIAHRLPVKRPRLKSESNVTNRRHPGIIVRFISRQKRNEMYSNRMKATVTFLFKV